MEELDCTLCNKKSLTKKEAIQHIFKDHLNYIPWTCSECDFQAYTITDRHVHENETMHIMAEAQKYSSNFRIFSIIYCDIRYVKKFGEENLDRCRIVRPSIHITAENIIFKNIVEKNKSILLDQNIHKEDDNAFKNIKKNTNKKITSINNDGISKDPQCIKSKSNETSCKNNVGELSVNSDISFQSLNNETKKSDKTSLPYTTNDDSDDKKDASNSGTNESSDTSTKMRKRREQIRYDMDCNEGGECIESYDKPSKKLRCSYNVLKPTLSSNKYILQYSFILDGSEISRLLPTSNITNCKVCGKEVRNKYDILNHIRHYHNYNQEYNSPILSCGIKRCIEGFDDIDDLRIHAKNCHNISKFCNNIDAHEKRREKNIHVNMTANSLLKYEQLFVDCFPNLILNYCGEPLEKNKNVQLFLSYSSGKCDYLDSRYFYKKINGKNHIACDICKKLVPVERYLIRHVMENHMNRNDKSYNILACHECKEPKYYDMKDLEEHWERKHGNIGPFFNNCHIKFDKIPMRYMCVASIMPKDDLKAYEVVFEQAYPSLKIDL